VKRGEIWTAATPGSYTGKPRPVAIVQNEAFVTESITVCGFTTTDADVPLLRPVIRPTLANGLREMSRLMPDKIASIPKQRLGKKIGELSADDLRAVDAALMVFLGLTMR